MVRRLTLAFTLVLAACQHQPPRLYYPPQYLQPSTTDVLIRWEMQKYLWQMWEAERLQNQL